MKVSIIGNGSWGSALATMSRRKKNVTQVWGRNPRSGETNDLAQALRDATIVLLTIPSHAMREICNDLKPLISSKTVLVSMAKGIEQESLLRMSEIIQETTGHSKIAVMSGPTFASEIEKGLPSALVCASADEKIAKAIQNAFNHESFRVYTHHDVAGVELGGALKNIMAIAAGACEGMGLGENARAALITRGFMELTRIGTSLGGESQTFYGLSGIGDLILTCSSPQSRNHRVGEGLGKGKKLPNILASLTGTAEGIKTSRSVHQILAQKKLEAPILQEIYSILYEDKPVPNALKALMTREPKAEFKK